MTEDDKKNCIRYFSLEHWKSLKFEKSEKRSKKTKKKKKKKKQQIKMKNSRPGLSESLHERC